MEITPPKYQVKDDGRIVYVLETEEKGLFEEYTVWGFCEKGFIHGAGSYLRRKNFGIPYTIIDKPSPEEFKRYYEIKQKLEDFLEDKLKREEEENYRKFLKDDGTRESGDEWKDLLDDDDDDDPDDVPF